MVMVRVTAVLAAMSEPPERVSVATAPTFENAKLPEPPPVKVATDVPVELKVNPPFRVVGNVNTALPVDGQIVAVVNDTVTVFVVPKYSVAG